MESECRGLRDAEPGREPLLGGAASADCAANKGPCTIPVGTYHIILPDEATGPIPAILLLHGYGGEGLGTIRNTPIFNLMLGRGYAVIAPDGQPRDDGEGRTRDFHPDRPATCDETAVLTAVADDAATRFGLRRDRMLLAGFSIGGSMTSYVASTKPEAFAAFATVAGSLWRRHPKACAGPVRLFHTHSTADRTVPIEGREIMPGFVQGNVFEAMGIWREANGCPSPDPDITRSLGIYTIQDWTRCDPVCTLSFALHEGGHSIPKGWAQTAIDWFEAAR